MLLEVLIVAGGAAVLAYSGNRLVDFAAAIAEKALLTPAVIGLTIVAAATSAPELVASIGTSLPELAVSLAAALRRQQEMAAANVVGSNIFDLLMILGAAGLARPLPVDARMISVDSWVMMAFTALLFPLVFRRGLITRGGGSCLLAVYAGYVAWLAWNPQ
jgi:cation:H+ antiporter